MTLVSSTQIGEPKIKVSPPAWALTFVWAVFALSIFALTKLQGADVLVKYALVTIGILMMLGVLRNHLKGNFLVTMQANKDGLYFQARDQNQYFYVPWKNVGIMEKTIFPLNSRGLRIEITGESVGTLKSANHVGNVRTENGRTFVYTIPQLRNRDKLIDQFSYLKQGS